MRQLLILGFYCEVYRREPLCRVYLNEILVDEFNIPHTPRSDSCTAEKTLDPTYWSPEQFNLQYSPPFFKFLEWDDAGDRSLNLRIEVLNDDNNYANGFINKHSLVMLSQCWMASVKVWEQFDQIRHRWKFTRHNWQKYFGCKKIIDYYPGFRNLALDNLARYADIRFPGIIQQTLLTEEKKTRCSNYQDLPQPWQDFNSKHWTGSSGYFHITLAKKLGFWRHSNDRRRGWWKSSNLDNNAKDIYYKYTQHEDKRNSNQ